MTGFLSSVELRVEVSSYVSFFDCQKAKVDHISCLVLGKVFAKSLVQVRFSWLVEKDDERHMFVLYCLRP